MARWVSKKAAVYAGVVALLLVLPGSWAIEWADANLGAGRSLVVPQKKPDPVPVGREIKELPPGCGVSTGTAKTLAPGADKDPEKGGAFRQGGRGDCMWYSLDDGKAKCEWCPKSDRHRNERVLWVKIKRAQGDRAPSRQISPIGMAMRDFAAPPPTLRTQPDGTTQASRKPVAGLGDEAVVFYTTDSVVEGAIVVFRFGNVVAEVRYGGWDREGGSEVTLSEDKAVAGALKAATESATSLGAPAKPTLATPPADPTPPIPQTRGVCGMVSKGTVKGVVKGSDGGKGPDIPLTKVPGAKSERCDWYDFGFGFSSGLKRHLVVTVDYLPDVRTAAREYVRLHHDGRMDDTFSAFTAPGEQSFGSLRPKEAYGKNASTEGLVVFRLRNVLVQVTYEGLKDGKDIPSSQAINGAYTVALDVAKALSAPA